MLDSTQPKKTLTDWPIGVAVFGLIFFSVGVAVGLLVKAPNAWIGTALFGGIGGLILLFGAQVLTITLDRTENKMTLQYRALLWWSKKEIPLSEIGAVQVERSVSTDTKTHSRSYTFRVVIVRKDGTRVPLRDSFSSGESGKCDLANKISDYLGLGPSGSSASGAVLSALLKGVQPAYRSPDNILADMPVAQEQMTNGIHWRLETHTVGTSPVTRWVSNDFKTPGYFVILTQKVDGTGVNDLLGNTVGRFLTHQVMSLYGFGDESTPGLGQAKPVPNSDPRLNDYYETLTSAPGAAQQILNPWTTEPLLQWAQQFPVQQFQSPNQPGPLLVLFSPEGLYLAFFNVAGDEVVQRLAQLGADLVRAQGSGPGSQPAW